MKNKIFLWSTILFLCLQSIDLSLLGINLSVFCGVAISLVYLYYAKINISPKYINYIIVLLSTIIYATLIDLFNNKIDLYLVLSKIYILFLGILFISVFQRVSKENFDYIITKTNILLAFVNFISIAFLFIPSLSESVMKLDQNGFRFSGFAANSNGLAMSMVFVFSISLYSFFLKKNIISYLALLITIFISIMTQSRGLYVGLFLQFFIFYFFSISFKRKSMILKSILKMCSIIMLIAFFIPFAFNFLDTNFGLKLSRFSDNSDANVKEISIYTASDERYYLYEAGFKTLLNKPFGVGFTDNHKVIGKQTNIFLLPHNFFISLFLYYGIIFGFFWVMLFIIPLIKYYNRRNKIDILIVGFFISFIISLSVFIFTHSSDSLYIWIYLSIAFALLNNRDCLNKSIIE